MPAKHAKGAQRSNAQAMLAAKGGAPDGLNSFLGGFVAAGGSSDPSSPVGATPQQEQEGAIAMNLKLLTKSSDITKQKSLHELVARVAIAREDSLSQFVPNIAEAVIAHAHHLNPQIRASVFALLKTLMERGKAVKVSLVPSLPALAPAWVMGMHDMEATVRQEAREAFEAAFSPEKRPAMLLKYKGDILGALLEDVAVVAMSGKPLQDDQLDSRANHLFSALRAIGYMVKQVSESQTAVLAAILENGAFAKVLPSRAASDKKYIAAQTPLVRSAALALLRDVISVCPCTARLQQRVAQAVQGSIMDTDPTVAARLWELILFWCRANTAEMVTNLPQGFLDEVVDCVMECKKPELAEVIFPCLFPLLTQLSKDPRLGDVLDEFCGALVEKLRVLGETPNISAHEVQVVFQALMECWELHCVRKKGTPEASDCEELFTVVLTNLSTLLQSLPKRRRYQDVVVGILSSSLAKTAVRNEPAFKHCMAILTGQRDAPFVALPEDSDVSLVTSYRNLRATTVGALYGTAVREGTYSRQLPMFESYVDAMIRATLSEGDTAGVAAVFKGMAAAAGTAPAVYLPSPEVRGLVVDHLLSVIPTLPSSPTTDQEDAAGLSCKAVLAVALSWGDAACVERLSEVANGQAVDGVQEALRDHLLKDPVKAVDFLVLSCETNAFVDIQACVQRSTEAGTALSAEQRDRILQAVAAGLAELLHLVKGDDATMEHEKLEAAYTTNSSSDSGDSSDSGEEDEENGEDDDSDTGSESNESHSSHAEGASDKGEEEDSVEGENRGPEVAQHVEQWLDLLTCDGLLSRLLALDTAAVSAFLAAPLYRLAAALAPPLFPESYMSIKGLRVALAKQAAADAAGEDDAEHGGCPVDFSAAMDAKVHSLRTGSFSHLVDRLEEWLTSYAVPTADRDAFAATLLSDIVKGEVPLCYQAFQQFQHVAAFASDALFHKSIHSLCLSEVFCVRKSHAGPVATAAERLSLFDGYFSLSDIDVTLFSVVRTAQVLRLMESCGALAGPPACADASSPEAAAARPILYLLKAAVAREALSDSARRTLFGHLLPQALRRVDSKHVAAALVELITDEDSGNAYLLVTLGAVLRDMARSMDSGADAAKSEDRLNFLICGRRIMSAVTATAVDALFTSSGARGIHSDLATVYAGFYSAMDEAANCVRDNLLAQLPKSQEALFTEACMMLPTWDLTTAKLSLIVHRHLSSMPVIVESTVKSLVEYAQKQNPLQCVELLSELSMTRILALPAYSEVVRVIVHSLSRCYTLRHLPTNGRLTQLPADRPAPPALSFNHLRRVAVAAVVARHGVVVHSRSDDVLRSTVNLVVFDIVCEAVSRLRTTKGEEVPLLAKLIAFTTDFMNELLTSDVAVLRASETSVRKVASVLCFAYLWASVTPIARLEAIGMDTVAAVMRCVCQLANLILVRSSIPLQEAMRVVLEKSSLKPLRTEFSSAAPLKITQLRRQNALIGKTHKQRLLLFPYLLACAIANTCAAAPDTDATAAHDGAERRSFKARRSELCGLLDLLLSLLLSPYAAAQKRSGLEETFLGSALGGSGSGTEPEGNPLAGVLGFEVVALTRTDDHADPMGQLARGAASVFTLLLNGVTLSLVKGWMETLERKLQALVYSFVEVYVSPTLTQENLLVVLSHSPDGASTFNISDETSVRVGMSQRVIDLTYEMEDAKVSVSIYFPPSYPLRKPAVSFGSGRECGITNEKWRAWMLKMTALLFGGTSNIWSCVELFQHNLDAHLGGQEPCPICFAVVSAVDHKLPGMRCSVCHNSAFHSSCLYTWWANGGQNVCPLCRSPWISE